MSIGARIRSRRIELQMSQQDLADMLGYKSRSSINKIELDERNLTQQNIKAIADALMTTPEYIMGWADAVQGEEMTKVAENMYTLTRDEEEILVEYVSLTDEGKAELMKHLQLLKKVYAKEE